MIIKTPPPPKRKEFFANSWGQRCVSKRKKSCFRVNKTISTHTPRTFTFAPKWNARFNFFKNKQTRKLNKCFGAKVLQVEIVCSIFSNKILSALLLYCNKNMFGLILNKHIYNCLSFCYNLHNQKGNIMIKYIYFIIIFPFWLCRFEQEKKEQKLEGN